MSKAEPPQIGIAEFVRYVRKEIQKAQDDAREEARQDAQNEAKKPFFQLDTVELEIKFVTEKEGKAGIKLFVASLGGNYSREQTHTVRLGLTPYAPKTKVLPWHQNQIDKERDEGKVILGKKGLGPIGKTKP